MPVNFDEKLLLSQRIDPTFEEPVLNQILRIAIYDEYHAFETYTKVIQKFGPVAPFVNIVEAEKRHYSALLLLCEKYQVEPPVNDWSERLEIPNSLVECSEVGVAAEIDNIAMYDHLLMYTQHPDIQDVLFQLQAASYNNHLPAFRKAVASSSMTNNSNTASPDAARSTAQADTQTAAPEDLLGKMDDYKALIQSVMSGNIDQAELGKLLSSSNMSLISGLMMGGFGTMLFNNMKNDSSDKPNAETPHKTEPSETVTTEQ
jgi:hypothetical protein